MRVGVGSAQGWGWGRGQLPSPKSDKPLSGPGVAASPGPWTDLSLHLGGWGRTTLQGASTKG